MARTSAPAVVVVGSLNIDLIAAVEHLPRAGETVCAEKLERRFGGKGANQALAAARQGAQVTLIGCLGDDPDGRDYRNHLRREGINCSALNTVRETGTGNAFISVDSHGENQIVVVPGANQALTAPALKMQRARIAVARVLLTQLEVPLPTVMAALEIANEARVPVVLNASPCRQDFPWGSAGVDVLVLNEGEARSVFDLPVDQIEDQLPLWQAGLRERGVANLIVTRGEKSTLLLDHSGLKRVPVLKVNAVNTVGAGDTFAGALACHLGEGTPLLECVRWANAAAGLATQVAGAQEGVPTRGEVQSVLVEPDKKPVAEPVANPTNPSAAPTASRNSATTQSRLASRRI